MPSDSSDNEIAPAGCLALAFTDVESSTALWESDAAAMRRSIGLHHWLLRSLLAKRGGYEVKTEGDAFMVAFGSPAAAVAWALDCQRDLLDLPWPPQLLERAEAAEVRGPDRTRMLYRGLRVRIGVHLGEPECVADRTTGRMDYFGPMVNRAARVSGAAHGGQVLISDAVRAALGGALDGARIRALGTYHLKGLGEPEPLHEVLPEELGARTFPPVRARAPSRSTLPRRATAFLGRERELADLLGLFRRGERLVTILGPGGMGKTRLAIELGRRLAAGAGRDESDILFCDLTATRGDGDVVLQVAQSLGLAMGAQATARELVEAVGSQLAEWEGALVILDNFEQVAAHAAGTLGRWRQSSPETRFLVTSRERLGLEGERVFRLSPLDPEAAVQLFLERASRTSSIDRIDPAERAAVAEIARRLDGIPLALELAAGRTGVLSIRQIEEQLAERFRLLSSSRRDLTARQATLRGSIDWSWELLSEPERAALRQAAVFRGFSLEAAERVIDLETAPGAGWVLDVLQSLADRSMVRADRTERGVRFYLHESIRAYAGEKLEEAGEGPGARDRHGRYFAGLAAARLTGAFLDDERVDTGLREAETDNLSVALDNPDLPPEQALRIALALAGQAYISRPLEETASLARRIGELAPRVDAPELRSRGLQALGICRWLQGDHPSAARFLADALAEAERAGDERQRALVIKDIAGVHLLQGDEELAEARLTEALVPARACGDPVVESRILGNLGHVRYRQFRFERSQELFEQQRALAPGKEGSLEWAFSLTNLAGALIGLNRLAEARECYESALEVYVRRGHFRFDSMTRCGLAFTRVLLGEGALALADIVQTLEKARRFGLKWPISHALLTLGIIRLESLQGAEALATLEEGIGAARDAGDQNMLSLGIVYRATARAILDEPDAAEADLALARPSLGPGFIASLLAVEGIVMLGRARVAARAGDEAEARRLREAALARHDEARGWLDGTLPPPTLEPGGRFLGVSLPILERALVRDGLIDPAGAAS